MSNKIMPLSPEIKRCFLCPIRSNQLTEINRQNEQINMLWRKVRRLEGAIQWALGETGEFEPPMKPEVDYFWWRPVLKEKSGIILTRSEDK